MNKIASIASKVAGGSVLFAVAFVGFAKLNGAELHSLPVLGGLFPAVPDAHESEHTAPETAAPETAPALPAPTPPKPEEQAQKPELADAGSAPAPVEKPAAKPKTAHAGIFEMLDVDALYTQDELRSLAESLRAKNREAELRGGELDRREELLADRLTALEERRHAMDEFAKKLDARERELTAREAEANRDTLTGANGKPVSPSELATFFAEGESEVLVQRLTGFRPEEAAQILIRLAPTRAKELLDSVPSAHWREFAEAYARTAQKPPE